MAQVARLQDFKQSWNSQVGLSVAITRGAVDSYYWQLKKKSNNNFCQSVKNINPHNNTARLHQYNLNLTLDYMCNPNFQQSCRRSFISETGLGTGHSRGDLKMCLQLFPHRGAKFTYCQAQSQLNLTQPQLKLRLRLALVPGDPATRSPTRESSFVNYF